MKAYYNEHDPKTAAWLRELIRRGLIADGDVDERSISDVCPSDLDGYTQCHFFAGIGGWSLALRLAGWPDDRPVWTGSCPCQPFSTAGEGRGVADERHLWPDFYWLIQQCRPAIVFGEQVASEAGRGWLTGVRVDLEGVAYEVGGADLCAPCTNKPHLRKRLFWVAHPHRPCRPGVRVPEVRGQGESAAIGGPQENQQKRYRRFDELVSMGVGERVASYSQARALLYGIPERLALMRGAGNAIVPQVAAEFIQASEEAIARHRLDLATDWI